MLVNCEYNVYKKQSPLFTGYITTTIINNTYL